MHRESHPISRRRLLAWGAGTTIAGLSQAACSGADGPSGAEDLAASGGHAAGSGGSPGAGSGGAGEPAAGGSGLVDQGRDPAAVSVVRCPSYDVALVHESMRQALDQLGDLRGLVQGKVVGIKPNLTGSFESILGRSAGETYIAHGSVLLALSSLLFEAGARRVRVFESIPDVAPMTELLSRGGVDVNALLGLGDVELENTRNLGASGSYARLVSPTRQLYSYFDVNRAYEDVDVMVSLAKMKNHTIAGVTLTMKNLFGMTPLSLYGTEAELGEDALGYRGPTMHDGAMLPPGEIAGFQDRTSGFRVSRIVVDEVAARPIDLAVIDGITSMSGGEGPWSEGLALIEPGLLIAGWNPVATDAVATKIMGYEPLAMSRVPSEENHILLAHQAGLGNADTSQLDVRGLSISDALYPFG